MFGGCLPMLPTIPIMYLLYFMISRYQYQFSHGTFLWIGSGLSHLFPSIVAPNLGQQDIPLLAALCRLHVCHPADDRHADLRPAAGRAAEDDDDHDAVHDDVHVPAVPSAGGVYPVLFDLQRPIHCPAEVLHAEARPRTSPCKRRAAGTAAAGGFLQSPNGSGGGQAKSLPSNGKRQWRTAAAASAIAGLCRWRRPKTNPWGRASLRTAPGPTALRRRPRGSSRPRRFTPRRNDAERNDAERDRHHCGRHRHRNPER